MVKATNEPVAGAGRLREVPNRGRDLGPADDDPQAEVLSLRQFQKQLQIEKRRADRAKSALSLVLVRLETEHGGGVALLDEILGLLGRSKRETDILGHIGKDRLGILLPHTNEQGVEVFINGVAKRTAHLPISIASATYPDHLFDSLLNDSRDVSDTLAYLFDEKTELGPTRAFVKRAMDILGALIAILVFSPIMLAIAAAVAVSSPGSVIFKQRRFGKGGVPFVFYKFRSMRSDSDDRIHREYVANLIEGKLDQVNQGDQDRPLYKMTADPRVTHVGRIIRKTSLDELPQLFNVLKGDMSLVGPRPPLPYEAEKYQSWHLRRVLQIRPGITGLWQVEGRSTTSFDEMVRLDLRYIRNCSLWLDVKILLKTVKVVLRRDGAG
jgi:exopolysaccharide biosynthesis polyprenyl glycosylphosphotransferase